jgi:sugar O-acyltransferase (sialic acid O-acetyltransferase NeuD family)
MSQAMVQEVVIYGAGPFARVVRRYLEGEGEGEGAGAGAAKVTAYAADRASLTDRESTFDGLPLCPFEDLAQRHPPERCGMFVAIGSKALRARKTMFEQAKAKGYRLINVISRHAIIYPDLDIGENNILMPQVLVEPLAEIGHNNILGTGTMVCHEARVGDHNYVSAACVIGGGSQVHDLCFFGNGAITINSLSIASETHAMPGAVFIQNTQASTKYLGSPARAIGTHGDTGIVIARG